MVEINTRGSQWKYCKGRVGRRKESCRCGPLDSRKRDQIMCAGQSNCVWISLQTRKQRICKCKQLAASATHLSGAPAHSAQLPAVFATANMVDRHLTSRFPIS